VKNLLEKKTEGERERETISNLLTKFSSNFIHK